MDKANKITLLPRVLSPTFNRNLSKTNIVMFVQNDISIRICNKVGVLVICLKFKNSFYIKSSEKTSFLIAGPRG
jgi:hypothetical protein